MTNKAMTIDVDFGISNESTAKILLALVESYCNANDATIKVEEAVSGGIKFSLYDPHG